jgi:hypothetical protein
VGELITGAGAVVGTTPTVRTGGELAWGEGRLTHDRTGASILAITGCTTLASVMTAAQNAADPMTVEHRWFK